VTAAAEGETALRRIFVAGDERTRIITEIPHMPSRPMWCNPLY
jgi:hypothetical protein